MTFPEHIIQNFVRACLKFMREDYATQPTGSMLESLFKLDGRGSPLKMDTVDLLAQAVKLFTRTAEHQKQIEVSIGYQRERHNMPHIHIMLPGEAKGRFDSLGNVGKNAAYPVDVNTQTETITKTKTYLATYQLVCTGENTNEILMLYYFLKSIFTYFDEHLAYNGLYNLAISGQDVQFIEGAPDSFHRALTVQFDYETTMAINWNRDMASTINMLLCGNIDVDYDAAYPDSKPGTHTPAP